MSDFKQTRRQLLKGAGLTLFASPWIIPASIFGDDQKAPPSERLTIGHIGVGNEGGNLFRAAQPLKEAQSVAIADCFKSRREGLAAVCKGRAYLDYREILTRNDIDLVIIATPDHWHVPIAIAAAKANKHAYVEKPLGRTIAQNLACEAAFKQSGTAFQYGTQQRSHTANWLGCELVRRGAIGKITSMEVEAPDGASGGSTDETQIPEELGKDGYEMWCGPAPIKPYTSDRCTPPGTYWIYDYSIGYLGGWGAHPLDIMVWGSDADLSGPIRVEGTGTIPTEGLYDTVYRWDMKLRLGELDVTFKAGANKTRFIGENGWIEVHRGNVLASDPELLKKPIDEDTVLLKSCRHTDHDFILGLRHHLGDFLKNIKTGTPPVSSLRDAVRSDNFSHLCDIAVRTNSTVLWDPAKRTLIHPTSEQKERLDIPMRTSWKIT